MKLNTIILLGTIITSVAFFACDFASHTEPEINIDTPAILGEYLYINDSPVKPTGMDTLYINEGDTVTLDIKTRLLEPPNYLWKVINDNVLKIIPHRVDSCQSVPFLVHFYLI